ncbi:MAG: hypothetical protein COU81_03110 [Candidatus Portnoybacteria bacterium CG10_big_fil_rev_8_21_14_0_10_36_7]|uniref:Uncharacterized protein n=1 Tax=Candidatus Portnoybacteria bacterium CG10_big_fil_rev_8_21_14_0_10_36_7 TaxID=1974812 RepID=A0A2M8KDJ9_9BACT|nr:MAG: hypothetical protein COU81_03110 [Candidatus Portnoybacteria bacterium CG10_big_fil_rev_8_21_14_0_10_36_7]
MTKYKVKIIVAIVAALVVALFLTGLRIANFNRAIYGLRIANILISGSSRPEIFDSLDTSTKKFLATTTEVKINNELAIISPEQMGVLFDMDITMHNALSHGHEKNIFQSSWNQVFALFFHKISLLQFQLTKQN